MISKNLEVIRMSPYHMFASVELLQKLLSNCNHGRHILEFDCIWSKTRGGKLDQCFLTKNRFQRPKKSSVKVIQQKKWLVWFWDELVHTGGSATTALHGSHTKRCACCFRIDEGKGLIKIFSYGGEVSTAMCGTCRSFKSRLLNSNKVGTVRLPLQISTSFCVDLHRVLNLMGDLLLYMGSQPPIISRFSILCICRLRRFKNRHRVRPSPLNLCLKPQLQLRRRYLYNGAYRVL